MQQDIQLKEYEQALEPAFQKKMSIASDSSVEMIDYDNSSENQGLY